MSKLEDLKPGASVRGLDDNRIVTVVATTWYGSGTLELSYKDQVGRSSAKILYRHDEARLEVLQLGRPWAFDGDGARFRLVSEAYRINLAHLFDPLLAVHSSVVDPLPHQITAVYESMLPRQPLRFLLADDPGAGKTIMAGLLIKELMARGDLQRCLVCCPGSLAEQWQDELYNRFNLNFDILTNDKVESSRTGNWFLENDLVIARLDKLARDEDLQKKLETPEASWDLIVCDEAHKMSATFYGNEIKYTKRFQLGKLLGASTRHFLLMTATPHNGKEQDFQLFMSLLDGDRFEGRFRDGVHVSDTSDLMRRMLKEQLLKFDGKRLFPDRIATTIPYQLSEGEAHLYAAVTTYVREEFDRAKKLENDKRAGTVGFALTILQRRLASSPEAIFQSLRRRRERLEKKLRELQVLQRGAKASSPAETGKYFDEEDLDDFEDSLELEADLQEQEVLDEATAARTIAELELEIRTLKHLENLAAIIRREGTDTKWTQLVDLLAMIFADEDNPPPEWSGPNSPKSSPRQKLVIFTEQRDTLTYLRQKIVNFLGREAAVVTIHGGMGREERLKAQEAFKHQREVQVLLATDAAGEGINLQRAHLMVNYDLPWNPNRLEQRFGRIHRIGQTEVCFLWNLVAAETREGDVYQKLLSKLAEAKVALGGQVFDVLGKLQFEGRSLRELLLEAILYGESPEVKAKLDERVENAFNPQYFATLIEEQVLVHEVMDVSKVQTIRAEMERADARRLQPNYIEAFFLEAFRGLGGTIKQREPRRYEVPRVPAVVKNRDRQLGRREPVLSHYERVTFSKDLIAPQDQPLAAFVCPGSPLLDSVIDLTLERDRGLLRQGAILVDDRDQGLLPRVVISLEHALQDGTVTRSGEPRIVSRRMLYVETDTTGRTQNTLAAPYLDCRPLQTGEPGQEEILNWEECAWITKELEEKVKVHAIVSLVPEHLKEVSVAKARLSEKARQAVHERLTKEINYWDHRSETLKAEELAGKSNAKVNSNEARRRADDLQSRLENRLETLRREGQVDALPPVITGGFLIIPVGLLANKAGKAVTLPNLGRDTQASAAEARRLVMEIERSLGFLPVDREFDRVGYDIESAVPDSGRLRFLEVKGRLEGSDSITVTKNEILYSLNKPDDYILAIVEFRREGDPRVSYVRRPFRAEPDFGVTSVNYAFADLLARGEPPS